MNWNYSGSETMMMCCGGGDSGGDGMVVVKGGWNGCVIAKVYYCL